MLGSVVLLVLSRDRVGLMLVYMVMLVFIVVFVDSEVLMSVMVSVVFLKICDMVFFFDGLRSFCSGSIVV